MEGDDDRVANTVGSAAFMAPEVANSSGKFSGIHLFIYDVLLYFCSYLYSFLYVYFMFIMNNIVNIIYDFVLK